MKKLFYVTADLNIGKEMAKPNFVKRWNDIVEENDSVIIMGSIGNYSKNLNFNKINGIFYLIDGAFQKYGFSTLKSMGIDYVWTNEFKIKTKIGGEESVIYIGNFEKDLKKNEYLCCGEKINNKV